MRLASVSTRAANGTTATLLAALLVVGCGGNGSKNDGGGATGGSGTGGSGEAGSSSSGRGGMGGSATAGTGGSSAGRGGTAGSATAGTGGGSAGRGGSGMGGLAGSSSAACPATEPRQFDPGRRQDFDACATIGAVCRYGTDCCSCNNYGTCGAQSFWWCVPQNAGCPAVAPVPGTTCSTQGQTCTYCDQTGTWFQLCNAGSWAGRNMLGCN
jgi:hypothetical protein